MSVYQDNKKAVDLFRKELTAMLGDISEIDKKVLNRAMNEGVAFAKRRSPVITGFFRKNWRKLPVRKNNKVVEAELVNNANYASFVNYGHRTVDRDGNTTGYVKSKMGDHLLEKTCDFIEKRMAELFEREVKAVREKHDK